MVGSLEWIRKFKNHEAFKRLKSKVSKRKSGNVSRNILAYRHGDVFLWDETTLSLLSFQLKNLLIDPNKDFCQELTWINPPRFEVDFLLLAGPSSNSLAIYGSGGVQVLFLPTHKLKVTAEASISCICSSIDEHFFVTSGHKLMHLHFHPGFSSPDVLFILTSNNFIRIYSTDQPQDALNIINLQPLSPIPLSSKSLFGESFVSFDFSEMLEMKTRNPATTPSHKGTTTLSTTTSTSTTASVPAWHLYLLMGNGQVSYCTVVFDGVNTFRHIMHGSMRMYPAADDNYGLDACSLLHLATTPPLLVVATSDGHLHHSLILNPEAGSGYDDDDDDGGGGDYTGDFYGGSKGGGGNRSLRRVDRGDGGDLDDGDDADGSFLETIRNLSSSFNQSGRALCIDNRGIISNPDNKKALYVYQTIELELQLSTPTLNTGGADDDATSGGVDNDATSGGADDDDAFYNRPILLYKDTTNKYRYHCTQPGGLHSILPLWLHNMEHFFAADKDEQWRHDDQTIVEHLVCTSPLPSSASSTALIGVAQITDAFLGCHLLALNNNYTLTIIPYLQSHKLETHPLKVESTFSLPHPPSSDSLLTKVSNMLIKDATNPIMSGSLDASMSTEECFALLCRTTQVFRTEYIAKYDLVRVELDKNVSRLEKVKARQLAEQERLQEELAKHRDTQEVLKLKLNRVLETQASLCHRLSRLTYNAEKGIGALSDAEHSALKKLRHLEQDVQRHQKSLSLLKKSCSYHDEVVSGTHLLNKDDLFDLPKEKTDSIKKLLKKEGEEIANLIKDLKKAQISVML